MNLAIGLGLVINQIREGKPGAQKRCFSRPYVYCVNLSHAIKVIQSENDRVVSVTCSRFLMFSVLSHARFGL